VLKLSSNVSDAFPKVLKLSSEVSECKPLAAGSGQGQEAQGGGGQIGASVGCTGGACGCWMMWRAPVVQYTMWWMTWRAPVHYVLDDVASMG